MLRILFLIMLLSISTQQNSSSSGLTHVLQQLNAELKTTLNIVINIDHLNHYINYELFKMPVVHIQPSMESFRPFRLVESFTKNSLIVVNMRETPLEAAVKNLLPYLLKELHELHIVFITEEHPNSWQEELYRYCFQEGFINTLLIHFHNGITSFYSYFPYPEMHILKLPKLEDYINRRHLLKNFHHNPFRTFVESVEPRKIQYVNRKGQTVHAGYIYNIFLEFIKRHNATLEFMPIKDSDNLVRGAISMLQMKEYDFACYPKELEWTIPSTETLYLLKDYVIVPHARPIASYLYFGRPFTWTLWLAVISTVVYGMLMLYASNGSDRSEIGLHLLNSLCHILFISQARLRAFNWQQWTIHIIMIISGFVLTNLYLAMLSSILTSGLFEPQLNTIQDLKHSPYRLLVDYYYIDYLKQAVGLPVEVKNRMTYDDSFALGAARTGLNSSFMYTVYEDRMEGILYQQHLLKVPRFRKIPESFMDGLMAFPVAPSLPYLNMLNAYLRRIFECGIFVKMKSDSWMDTIESGIYKLMRNEGIERKPFDLEFYYLAFALWAIGLVLACLIFAMEIQMWRTRIPMQMH
ncbi:hypothetical protein KR093_007514 [Drosophila rubida]|uniref:Ionotropic receptor n=1 Tax=Drosophila rubida TaxID=30044 RepID=A0AAD4K0R0_9MUSC|nr:hypothetical protein KR093_007514 [Drosophila rubida]